MKTRLRMIGTMVGVGLLVSLSTGCAGETRPSKKPDIEGGLRKEIPAFDRTMSQLDLQQIGLAYGECVDAGAGPPKSVKDIAPNLQNNPKFIKPLEDGRVVVAWGADPRRLSADTIIAYQKRAMQDGRIVTLIGAGGTPTPKVMTKAEFDAAPKAPGLEKTGNK